MTYIIKPKITNDQRQIILGTVLGGSSIMKPKTARNCYLSMRSNNLQWLFCKANELSFIQPPNPCLQEKEKKYYRWHSTCSPALNDFRELFYVNDQRIVRIDVLNELRDIGLAVWYIDAGKIQNNQVVIKTNCFGGAGTQIIHQYFQELSLPNAIIDTGKQFRVVLDGTASRKFVQIISQSVPMFMAGKLK